MTTEEFLDNVSSHLDEDSDEFYYKEEVKKLMIKFAKYHVEQALKEAVEKVIIGKKGAFGTYWNRGNLVVDEESILNSYDLTNIK